MHLELKKEGTQMSIRTSCWVCTRKAKVIDGVQCKQMV